MHIWDIVTVNIICKAIAIGLYSANRVICIFMSFNPYNNSEVTQPARGEPYFEA